MAAVARTGPRLAITMKRLHLLKDIDICTKQSLPNQLVRIYLSALTLYFDVFFKS